MPCLEIRIPRIDNSTKENLARSLTSVFADVFGFPPEIFGIHFQEYDYGDVASGGEICKNDKTRPYIHFLLYSPRVNKKTKRDIIAGFTSAYTECVKKPDWKPVIHICEYPYDNVGVEGKLLSDSYEECAKSKFYYELPGD